MQDSGLGKFMGNIALPSQIRRFVLIKLCANRIRNIFDLYDTVKPHRVNLQLPLHLWFFTPTLYLLEITESNYSNNSFNCRFTEKLTYFDILHLKEIQKIFSNRYEITVTRPINQSINQLLRAYSFFLPKINYQ